MGCFYMAKYSLEFKLKLVNESKTERESVNSIAKKNNIDHAMLRNWIRKFDKKGVEGLERSRKNAVYNQDFKIKIVQEYLSSEISYSDLALKYNISNYSLITRWKLDYEKDGIIGLQKNRKGRPPIMRDIKPSKDKRTSQEKKNDKDEIKELKMQNEILRAQNALLKKYQALGIPIPESMLKDI